MLNIKHTVLLFFILNFVSCAVNSPVLLKEYKKSKIHDKGLLIVQADSIHNISAFESADSLANYLALFYDTFEKSISAAGRFSYKTR